MWSLPAWLDPLPDAAAMRAIDRWAIDERDVPSLDLMERAGQGVAAAVEHLAPDGPICILCGKGNNGGDGLVAARLLREAGRPVDVLLVGGAPSELRGDARRNLQRLPGAAPLQFGAHTGDRSDGADTGDRSEVGGTGGFMESGAAGGRAGGLSGEPPGGAQPLDDCAIVVDALLGTGFAGAPRGVVGDAIDAINASPAPVVSVDIPSGVDASTGAVAARAVRATVTVTFHAAKPGLWIHPGKGAAGEVRVVDIGIPRGAPGVAVAGAGTGGAGAAGNDGPGRTGGMARTAGKAAASGTAGYVGNEGGGGGAVAAGTAGSGGGGAVAAGTAGSGGGGAVAAGTAGSGGGGAVAAGTAGSGGGGAVAAGTAGSGGGGAVAAGTAGSGGGGAVAAGTAGSGGGEAAPPAIGLIASTVLDLLPRRGASSTKFSSGHVLVVGGSRGLTGAPQLSARGAMRAGAGYVTACIPRSQQPIVAAASPPELMTRALADDDGSIGEAAATAVLEATSRGGALVLGPGLGRAPAALAFARSLARDAPLPLVLDADGLNAHAGALDALAARTAPTILTPHAGELARLLDCSSGDIERERLHHVLAATARARSVVVLKGDDTLIADPDGCVAVSPGAGPALATAGTGDVLSGILGALLATGLDPFTAAAAGVLLHLHAGRLAARAPGATAETVIASDVIAALPAARTMRGESSGRAGASAGTGSHAMS